MKPIIRALFSSILFSIPVAVGLYQCTSSPPMAHLGGSEVVGKLVTADSLPVAGAQVEALTVDSVDEAGIPVRFNTVEAVSSDNEGAFIFDSLASGNYFLFARHETDSLILLPVAFSPDPEQRRDLGTLVMKETGAIRGTVVPEKDGPDRLIIAHISGTSFMATVNRETGGFRISGIPPDTSYEVTVSSDGYRSVSIPGVFVKAGQDTILADTIRLVLDPADAPEIAPQGLTVDYDTLTGSARLTWNSVPLEDVKRYIVFHSLDQGVTWNRQTVNDTTATVPIFTGTDGSEELTLFFQVAAYDNDNNEGPRGEIDTLVAIPPSWLRVVIALGKVDGVGGVDSVYIAMGFSSRLRTVKNITWRTDDPDSVLKAVDVKDTCCGTDTLLWTMLPGVKRIYVTVIDNADSAWTDSLDAVTLLPNDRWELSDSLLEERRYAGACALGGRIYVFGGCREKLTMTGGSSLAGLKTGEVYDPATRQWSKIASMSVARMKAASAVVDGKIYVFGGTSGTIDHATVERYDTSSDEWEIVDAMTQPVVGAAACVVGGVVYLTGGVTGTGGNPELVRTIVTYDPLIKKWGTLSDLGIARQMHQTVAFEQNILVIGGLMYDERVDEMMPLKTTECIPVSSGSSCPSITLSTTRFGFCAAIAGEKLVLIGGLVNATVDEAPVASVEVSGLGGNSSPGSGTPMPVAREGSVAVVLDGRIFVIGGSESGAGAQKSTRAVYVYYP